MNFQESTFIEFFEFGCQPVSPFINSYFRVILRFIVIVVLWG